MNGHWNGRIYVYHYLLFCGWQSTCLTLEVSHFTSPTLLQTLLVCIIFILYSSRYDIQEQLRAPLLFNSIHCLVLYEAINFYYRHLMTPQIHHMYRWWEEIHTHWVSQLVKSHGYLTSALISMPCMGIHNIENYFWSGIYEKGKHHAGFSAELPNIAFTSRKCLFESIKSLQCYALSERLSHLPFLLIVPLTFCAYPFYPSANL